MTQFPLFYITLAFISGMFLPLQALINSRLGEQLGSTLWAAVIPFIVGTIALLGVIFVGRYPFPDFSQASTFPVWLWIGGTFGAFYIYVTIVSVQPLGTTAMLALIIGGQMIAALLFDHFGVLQTPHTINPVRLVGVFFLILGVAMILQK